jgi:hypothetical protein
MTANVHCRLLKLCRPLYRSIMRPNYYDCSSRDHRMPSISSSPPPPPKTPRPLPRFIIMVAQKINVVMHSTTHLTTSPAQPTFLQMKLLCGEAGSRGYPRIASSHLSAAFAFSCKFGRLTSQRAASRHQTGGRASA